MQNKKEAEIPDEVAMQLFDDMENLVKQVNTTLPYLVTKSMLDIEKRIIETEFKGLIMP